MAGAAFGDVAVSLICGRRSILSNLGSVPEREML